MRAHSMKRNQGQQCAFNAHTMKSMTFLAGALKQQLQTTTYEHDEECDSPDNRDLYSAPSSVPSSLRNELTLL